MRRTVTMDVLLPLLYLKGISTKDFEAADALLREYKEGKRLDLQFEYWDLQYRMLLIEKIKPLCLNDDIDKTKSFQEAMEKVLPAVESSSFTMETFLNLGLALQQKYSYPDNTNNTDHNQTVATQVTEPALV